MNTLVKKRRQSLNETRSFYTTTKSVTKNSTQNNDLYTSRNMVTGVSNDSTNQPKRVKIRSQSQPASKERSIVVWTPFEPDKINYALPMPKALIASLPTFNGKNEKFELIEYFVRNNIKMYLHLTELQKKLFPFSTSVL